MNHLIFLFLCTFGAAFIAVSLPGLVNITTAKISAKKGKNKGVIFALGASVAVTIQAFIGTLIFRYIYRNNHLLETLSKVALVIFAILAVYFFSVARKKKKEKKTNPIVIKKGTLNVFLKGLFVGLLNILPIVYFCGLNVAWNASGWFKFKLGDILIFLFAGGIGTFAMLYAYVVYFNKLEKKTKHFSTYSDYILGGLMVLLFFINLIQLYY